MHTAEWISIVNNIFFNGKVHRFPKSSETSFIKSWKKWTVYVGAI